ncbi:hypothetical protein MJO28_005413 [Puccinia striiformis f. sp. tritici]|uniref:Uncharacterized protein n=1 Tax=Puccinia striiformis f. sp. tritici TaxID=168172 RepID=A0ACC0EKM1_9BASI|nr:hypothetical protein MJO28_005413 [Puccinia striiformis f. sp. tritici]
MGRGSSTWKFPARALGESYKTFSSSYLSTQFLQTFFVKTIMIASHLLLVGLWFVRISIGLTALVDGPNLAIGVNQAEGDTSRSLRALSVKEEPRRRPKWMIPFKDNRRKIVRSEKGLETIKNWNINRDQVVPLHKYAVRLTKFEAEVQQQFVWLEENKIDVNKMITKASPQDLARAKESFNTIKEGIKVIKNMRLLHLGGAYDIPDDMFRLITESFTRDFLESLKEFITEHNPLFSCLALKYESKHPKFQYKEDKRYRLYTLTPLDYAFEIIDFLLEIQFISPEEVREIFQDKKMVEQVVNYTVRQHENDLGFSSWKFMVNLTKHWRWQSMNKFCTALSKKELDRIDLVFLIGRLKCIDALPNALYDSGVLKKGERPFLYEKYFGNSNSLDASNSLVSPGFKNGQIGHQIYLEFNSREKDEIIRQLIPKHYEQRELICIIDLFAFIEGEYCPGIVSQLSEDEIFSNKLQNLVKPTGNSHKPEDFFNLASVYSRNEMISHSAEQLLKSFFQDTKTSHNLYMFKKIYQLHIDKKSEILNASNNKYVRLPSFEEFHYGREYGVFSVLYPHCVEGDLEKMIEILDHTTKYGKIPATFIQNQPYYRAWLLHNSYFPTSVPEE